MVLIREGRESDAPRIMELIRELAIYEKALDQVENTSEQLVRDGFGANPAFGSFVCECNEEIIGMALYYYRYSTWKGRRLYLEDLIVTQSYRGQGYGKRLLDRVIEQAKKDDCSGVMWQVLDWNQPAINFYRNQYHARMDGEWINCHLDFN